jgi:hypothetical protein
MEEKAGVNVISKAWTVGGFIIGVAILAIVLITQSKILVNHDLSAVLKNWDENNDLILSEVQSNTCLLNKDECRNDSLVHIDAATRYEFNLILAGEVYIHIRMSVYMYTYSYVFFCIHIHVCTNIHIYIHIHISPMQ